MNKETAKKILGSVKSAYSSIADDFDCTRKTLWPGFTQFLQYIKDGDRILDAGCGNGRLSLLLLGKKVEYIGMDNNEALLKIARKNFPKQKFVFGDITRILFADESFDAVFCISTFHHLPAVQLRQQALCEMKRVLKPGGHIIMLTWSFFHGKYIQYFLKNALLKIIGKSKLGFRDSMIPWGDGPLRYYHLFSARELVKLFRRVELQILQCYSMKYSREKNLVIIGKKE